MRPLVSRRSFLTVSTTAATASLLTRAVAADSGDLSWADVRDWGVEGRGFEDTAKYFDRLPGRAEGVVRDAVWNLSRQSAGMMVRFQTDAPEIWADYAVTSPRLALPHMPATGVSGLDLYARNADGRWTWVAVCKPTRQQLRVKLVDGLRPGKREYAIYLPLYNGTESLRIGVPRSQQFTPLAPRPEKPIVFYGTSITHGACASRPGMPHAAILGRRFDRPVVNLGFSGNGKLESSVGQFLTELDPAVYVLDCLPNMVAAEIEQRAVPMVRQLRKAHPRVPIVLVEDRTYADAWIRPARQQRNESSRAAFRAAYRRMLDAGMEGLHYVPGDNLLAENRDDTTDGSHPSDLGFKHQADRLERPLRDALGD